MDLELEKIREVQREFVERLKENCFIDVDRVLSHDVKINCYMTGRGKGIGAVEELLRYPGPAPSDVKMNIENEILRRDKEYAQHSFHLLMLYTVCGENKQFHFMQYGGTMVLSYKKQEEKWKICKILFDLCWLDQNSYWVNSWKMLNFHEPWNHEPVIRKEDSVWRTVPVCEYARTDEEKIRETLYHFGWVTDTEDYELLEIIALRNVVIVDGYHNQRITSTDEWKEFLKGINYREPRLHHSYRIREILIDKDKAEARMSRVEPNRIGTKVIGEHNYFMDWFTMDCNVELIRVDKNWKIKHVEFIKNIYSSPVVSNKV